MYYTHKQTTDSKKLMFDVKTQSFVSVFHEKRKKNQKILLNTNCIFPFFVSLEYTYIYCCSCLECSGRMFWYDDDNYNKFIEIDHWQRFTCIFHIFFFIRFIWIQNLYHWTGIKTVTERWNRANVINCTHRQTRYYKITNTYNQTQKNK